MKILVIAGNEHLLIYEFVQKIYSCGYYIIRIVNTPYDAVLSMREMSPDAVILDMDFLFNSSDPIFLEEIHSHKNVPVIYAADNAVTDILDSSTHFRAFGYISYNCSEQEISDVLGRAFDNINLVKTTTMQTSLLNVILNNATTGIVVLSPDGKIIRHNKLFFEIFETVPSLDGIENITGGNVNFNMIQGLLHGNKHDVIFLTTVRGNIKYLHISVDTCDWYNDKIILMFVSDLTQVYKTKCSLAEAEYRFSKVFYESNEPSAIVECSTCRIYAVNSAFAKLYKVDYNACAGTAFVDYIGQETSTLLKQRAEGKETFSLSRIKQRNFAGDSIIVNFKGKKIVLDNSDYFLISIRNITEQLKVEEAKKLFQQQLVHANKLNSLGVLVSCMAHEINNPNNFIMFNASLVLEYLDVMSGRKPDTNRDNPMSREEIQADLYELADGISKGADRIKLIVDDLKSFARTGELGVFHKICLKDAIETTVRLLSHKIRKATKKFRISFSEDCYYIYGNQQRIEQVFMNIIMNAVEAVKKPTSLIEIDCLTEDGFHVVKVTDEGVGIPEEDLDKLLNPFYSTKFENGGTGLGLYIANNIIKEHRGSIDICSVESSGTTVTIKLPKYADV